MEYYLGISEILWAGIFEFINVFLVGGLIAFLGVWIFGKRRALNEQEAERLKSRIDTYGEILELFQLLEKKEFCLDRDLKYKKLLKENGLPYLFEGRNAVEYEAVLKSYDQFFVFMKKLDGIVKRYSHLVNRKTAGSLFELYLCASRINGYEAYLRLADADGICRIGEEDRKRILEEFLPVVGMVGDMDLSKAEVKLERAVVKGMYHLDFNWRKDRILSEKRRQKQALKYLSGTMLGAYEEELFGYFVKVICEQLNITEPETREKLRPNDLVVIFKGLGGA